jgi:hypothetical protein
VDQFTRPVDKKEREPLKIQGFAGMAISESAAGIENEYGSEAFAPGGGFF